MPLLPADLPLLLAGPILRRVESDLVSVWMATSRPCDVALLLFEGADVRASDTPDADLRAKWVSIPQPTLVVGANLHVLTVVLDLRTPGGNASRAAGTTLDDNTVYSYDLRIFERGNPTAHTFRSLRLLDRPVPLGYEPDELPSFKTCPRELDRLVVVHGSCRQLFSVPPLDDDPDSEVDPFEPPLIRNPDPPQTNGRHWPLERPSPESPVYAGSEEVLPAGDFPNFPKRDGMLWIDALIEARGPSPVVTRPHQLFLTGDQIYADQPSAVVLPVLNHLAQLLIGSEYLGASPSADVYKAATLEHFPPGFRGPIVRRSAGFTTSAGESHLLSFGEFIAYYLLTWSPALWELNEKLWPDTFVPADVAMPDDWAARFIHETDRPDSLTTADFDTLLEHLPEGGPAATDDPTTIARFYFDEQRKWITEKYWSPELFEWWNRRFRAGLPRVRRALANVPTYMLADDHDISDDWYFSRQWREQVFTRPLGVDILRNGMMALSLMQSWGNDPRRWSSGPEAELLQLCGTYSRVMTAAVSAGQELTRTLLDRLHALLGLPQTVETTPAPPFRPLVEYSYQVESPCHRALVVDGRTKRRFPFRTSQAGGIDYEGATGRVNPELPTGLPGDDASGLFGDSPMALALPPRPANDGKLTIVVTGVPLLGPEGMELALLPFQRLARLLVDVDAEAWSYEPSTYEAMLAALARYGSVVVLSGDLHIGYSAALDYWSRPDAGPITTARVVQLVSSGLTKDWGDMSPALRGHPLSLDVFESATNAGLMHAERIGWGAPLRLELTPPEPLGALVTQAERAHPSYRARLRMRAPVVPTHGWPEGTTEAREPNWAWRAVMARDERPEDADRPPSMEMRWTPVELPADPVDPNTIGWHTRAVRRMAFGRVFAVNPNVGIVTFQPETEGWSVRHILAGELPPMADTGNTPEGLQPFIVHRFALSPLLPSSWQDRPTLVADGAWGVDTTEPAFNLLVDALPRVWQGAAEFTGRLWDDMPAVLDDVTREGLISDAATRVSAPFRRRVISELGPFSQLPDADLDAVTPDVVAALERQVGRLDVDREARALVRPDIERLLAFNRSLADPAAMFDDLLLLGCSEWVNERHRTISLISGLLATFHSPLFKQVPITHALLGGLWDLWRHRTYADRFGTNAAAGLLSILPRAFVFTGRLALELLNHVIDDTSPRPGGGPPVFTPELLLTGLGAWQGMARSKRFTFVSGWESRLTPVAPGTRATERTAETIARQTLSLLLHPGDRPQFEAPAQKFSISMLPPPRDGDEAKRHGSLYIGWDGALEGEIEMGGGTILRGEADGRGVHQFLWGGSRTIDARVSGGLRITILRPFTFDLLPGVDVTLTPAIGVTVGVKTGQAESSYSPALVIRLALNDLEDRVRFKPDDELLVQLLPTDGISLPFDAAVEWSPEHGYRFAGFGEVMAPILIDEKAPQRVAPVRPPGADLDEPPFRTPKGALAEVVTPLNKRLGVLTFHERRLEVLTDGNADGVSLTVSITVTVSVNIGPVRIAVSGLGVNGVLTLRNQYEASDDLVDFSVGLPAPTALAISIDTDAISGGGFLQRLPRPGGGTTWRGGLALRLGRRYDVAAWGVVETGGGRPWTLLAFLVIRFSPAIPLTAGLKLVAVGGLVALNRTMDTDALRDAATGTQGTLDPILFPDRPEQRFLELLPAVERFFPPAKGSQVIGLMAEIEWSAATTGTRFGFFRLALLGELEKLQFGLYGTAQLGFPRLEDPHILRVRASVEALYDHRAKFARFSLTLTEAFLFERVHLTGGAAVLIRWGDRCEFAITLGGFHPSFRPFIPEGLREPPRLGAYWKPHRLIELDIKGYFALTSTSLQFGYAAHIEAGASWGGIRADTEFNFLVMTSPDCRFELDLSFRVTAYLFGADLISAGFSGSIKGPGPWVLEGSIYWEVCGVDLSKDLGPYEWGDQLSQVTQAQQARQVIGDAIADPASWTTRRSPRLPVRLRPGSDDALDPRDQLDIRQTRLPLGVGLEMHDANSLTDRGVWTLRPSSPGIARVSDLTDVFPTRRYLQRPPKETPFKGNLASGTRIGGTGWGFNAPLAILSDEAETEDLVLDTLPAPPKRVRFGIFVSLVDAVFVALPAQSPERKWTRHAITLEPRA